MNTSRVVLMTDHSSMEGSRAMLDTAIGALTGQSPVLIDARQFMIGGSGRVSGADGALRLRESAEDPGVRASVVLIYEIPPHKRRGFEVCQRMLRRHGAVSLGTGAGSWRTATRKDLMAERFARAGIAQMETISLSRPSPAQAAEAFQRLGQNVWARPTVGMGGNDVFHVTTYEQLAAAARHYATTEQDWLVARDASNFSSGGRRHQFRPDVLLQPIRGDPPARESPTRPDIGIRGFTSVLSRCDHSHHDSFGIPLP